MATPDAPDDMHARRGIGSFVFVATALMIGSGVLGWTLGGSRNDCAADCHVVTAVPGPTAETGARPVAAAAVAPRSDATMTEGRSVAEPALGADAPKPAVRRKHRHNHHHAPIDF